MSRDPSAARQRRKDDLLMASALLRDEAGRALDELQQRSEAVEATVQGVRDRVSAWLGHWARWPAAGLAAVPAAWRRPALAMAVAAWAIARRRRKARAARPAPTPSGSWAVGSLLLVALPRLWRWSRHGRRAWRVLRWWRLRESVSRQAVRS